MWHPDGGGSATSGVLEADAARHPCGRVQQEGSRHATQSGSVRHHCQTLADVSTSLPLLHSLSMSLSLTISPSPRSMVSSMKQKEVEELLQWVEELEQAEAWLLGKKKAAENVSSMAARGGASAASVFFSYIF